MNLLILIPFLSKFKIMNLKYAFLSIVLVSFLLTSTSCKKELTDAEIEARLNTKIMQWMYDTMDEVYFWNSKLPSFNSVKGETDPEVFFDKLIYTPEDKWSWLTKDYAALQEEFAGTPTSMGISPFPGLFSGSDKVFIVVAYVYPDSPAAKSGLKRGDIIMRIDNKELTKENYYSLFSQSKYSVTLGHYYNGSISLTSKTIALVAEVIDSNPIVFDTVLNINNSKIAYLTYVEFISGTNEVLLNEFGLLMDEFKNEGATDLVIDLRYNPGGEISAANYLASCIAPEAVVANKKIFVEFIYNPQIQLYFETEFGSESDYLINRFIPAGHNANFNKVYFLVSDRSASASELLMIGLKPYMDVYQIGDTTYGKYTGAWVLPDQNTPPEHNWAIVPIVSKYSNSAGLTDFKEGLAPDFYIKDRLLEAKAFGDISDPMLAKAIELITGVVVEKKKNTEIEMSFKTIVAPDFYLKSNLILETPDFLKNIH